MGSKSFGHQGKYRRFKGNAWDYSEIHAAISRLIQNRDELASKNQTGINFFKYIFQKL